MLIMCSSSWLVVYILQFVTRCKQCSSLHYSYLLLNIERLWSVGIQIQD